MLALVIALSLLSVAPNLANAGPESSPSNASAIGNVAQDNKDASAVKAPASEDKCAKSGLMRVGNTNNCTHGPDPVPPGLNLAQDVAPVKSQGLSAASVNCGDDGVSGNRVQVIYARASNVPDRYDEYVASFRTWAMQADDIYNTSAAKTGGTRHIRFVTTGGGSCEIVVLRVTLTPTGDDNFTNTINEMTSQGLTATNRKYMVFMDANVLCGIGSILPDTRRDAVNQNNFGPTIGRSDAGCWGAHTVAHELMHNLGGVQMDAPNTSNGFHCVDEYDVMCYSDSPNFPVMRYDCGNIALENQLDCNNDDYFSTDPPVGSYLATHWNSAQNRFLIGAVDQPPMPPPANDEISGAIHAGTRPFSYSQNGATAVDNLGDPQPSCYIYFVTQSLWYKTTPSANGTLTVDTFGSGYDTVLAVYSGSPGSLTQRACNDDSGNPQSRVDVAVTANTTYFVMVIPYYTDGAGTLMINVDGPADASVPTPTDTATATDTATPPPTATQTQTSTATPTATASATASSTATSSATSTDTAVSVETSTNTAVATDTVSATNTSTATATTTATHTASATNTSTATATTTATHTASATNTSTATATATTTATHTASATNTSTATASATPTATKTIAPQPAQVVLSKDKSKFNGAVIASLTGFTPNSAVTLKWPRLIPTLPTDDTETNLLVSGVTNASGAVNLTFRTPLDTLGDYTVTARDATGRTANTVLRVIPRILLNEESGDPDLRWRVYFYGFGAGDQIEVRWHNGSTTASSYKVIKILTVAANGRASAIIPIPTGQSSGVHMIVGKVIGVSRSASTPFTLTAPSSFAEPTVTPTTEASPTATSTPNPAQTVTPTSTSSPTSTATPQPTETATVAPTPSPAPTESVEPSATLVPTETPTLEIAPTEPPIIEPTDTSIAEPTIESTLDPTLEQTPSPTSE